MLITEVMYVHELEPFVGLVPGAGGGSRGRARPQGDRRVPAVCRNRQGTALQQGGVRQGVPPGSALQRDGDPPQARAILNFREFAVDLCGHVDFPTPTPSRKIASAASLVIGTPNIFGFPIRGHARLQLCFSTFNPYLVI